MMINGKSPEVMKAIMADRQREAVEEASVSADTDTIDVLNHLFNVCRTSAETYRLAASNINNEGLRVNFNTYAQQRSMFAVQLAVKLADLGGEPADDISVNLLGTLHQAWINVKSAVTGGDEHAILVECERAEDVMINAYDEALKASLPEGVRDMLTRQIQGLNKVHDHILELRETTGIQ